tara:strand:+ start:312 stop:425 length:114 start_codon:yes stop_codon:yes gene_type:complete
MQRIFSSVENWVHLEEPESIVLMRKKIKKSEKKPENV